MRHSIPQVGCEVPRDETTSVYHCKRCVTQFRAGGSYPVCDGCGDTASEGILEYGVCMLCEIPYTEEQRDAGGWWTEDGAHDMSCPACTEANA